MVLCSCCSLCKNSFTSKGAKAIGERLEYLTSLTTLEYVVFLEKQYGVEDAMFVVHVVRAELLGDE
jgi:hypothetical protein